MPFKFRQGQKVRVVGCTPSKAAGRHDFPLNYIGRVSSEGIHHEGKNYYRVSYLCDKDWYYVVEEDLEAFAVPPKLRQAEE